MFPAHKPSDIPNLPLKYYLAMREYYVSVRRAEMRPQSGSDFDSEVPGFSVVDFDKNMAEGKPI
jgi:hypothetical protein